MNKKILIILGIVAIIILSGGGFLVLNSNSDNAMSKDMSTSEDEAMMKDENKMTDTDIKMMQSDNNSKYVEYSSNILDDTDGKRVLFFYASWCPTCRPADEAFKTNVDQIPDGVKLIRVNYNDPETDQEEKDLAKKYGITYQHTFVQIDENGSEIAKWNGGQLDELSSNIK